MADREKLIELLGGDMCKGCYCEDCEHENNEKACIEHIKSKMADHLIANGVTVQDVTDINVGNKWISVKDRLPEDDLPKDSKRREIRCFVATNKGSVKTCVRMRHITKR